MSYNLYIHGIKPISDSKKMNAHFIRKACMESHISEPEEIETILGDNDNTCDRGEKTEVETEDVYEQGDPVQYINIEKLHRSGIKFIRLHHSY